MTTLTAGRLRRRRSITRRNLIKIKRVPDLLVFATLSPIMFVLLFRFVFGGAINVPGDVSYREFLMPGIFAQTVDLRGDHHRREPRRGHAEGHDRPVPVAADGPLGGAGRPDGRRPALNAPVHRGHGLTGLIVGWRIHTSVCEALGGFLLLLVFAYAISWLMALVGLTVRTPEVVNNAASSSSSRSPSSPTRSCRGDFPPVLRTFAEWNPVSSVAQAARDCSATPSAARPDVWSLQHPVALLAHLDRR